jgi:hypothetical protein
MDILAKAREFETRKLSFRSASDRILASREAKNLILSLNEIYKQSKEDQIMDLMKRLTETKRKIEKKLYKMPKV